MTQIACPEGVKDSGAESMVPSYTKLLTASVLYVGRTNEVGTSQKRISVGGVLKTVKCGQAVGIANVVIEFRAPAGLVLRGRIRQNDRAVHRDWIDERTRSSGAGQRRHRRIAELTGPDAFG